MGDSMKTLRRRLGELVALPSVSSLNPAFDMSNQAVVERLATWFADAGFAVEQQLVDAARGKSNLIARLGEGEDGLVLSGHTDTVPCDAHGWSSDPFTLTERDGRWYGLGACDMKAFFPLVLAALEGLDRARLHAPLVLLATADEESSMSGVRRLIADRRVLGRRALIGEPTGLVPIHMHKGVMMLAVEVTGRSGHASDPGLGNNALEGMHRVMGALLAWRARWLARHADRRFRVASPTLNLGAIRGGDNPNRICGSCELSIDLRVLPGMDTAALAQTLQRVVAGAVAGTGLQADVRPLTAPVPALYTPQDSETVRVAEVVTGRTASTIAFGTEAPFLTALGVETVILGAGNIEVAHRSDEYIPLEHVARMVDILRRYIGHFCGHARLL